MVSWHRGPGIFEAVCGPAAALWRYGAVSVSEVVAGVCLGMLSSSQEGDYLRMCQLGTAVEAN